MESHIRYIQLNPAQFVVSSFLCLILVGTILLKLPYSTTNGIAFIDALFTATSAVCITGLVVVDTGTCFTFSGQIIIMLLMQSGALGILTFATYFSYFVKGGSSYSTQITMSSISNSEKVDDVFKILKRILYITIGIESVGAICIYFSLNSILIPSITDRLFFSAFHAVSAFCNAGFSTLKNGIMETGYVTNYLFQLSLFFLFFTGSLGFPIVTNLLKYLKHVISSTFLRVIYKKRDVYKPRIMTLNSRINLITTFLLTIVGVCFFFISEDFGV